MSLYTRVIQTSDIDEILQLESTKLQESQLEQIDREIYSWSARWRKESLEHYIPRGWSFLARDKTLASNHSSEGLMVGYFIAQPLLYFDGHPQSLWLEHIQYMTLEARDELCELAYKLCREKHFQKVLYPESQSILNAIKNFKSQNWNPQVLMVPTTKMSSGVVL